MTLFSADLDCTCLVCGADIVYENGAKVKTSFLTNMLGGTRIMGDPDLYRDLSQINDSKKVNLPKYDYPIHLLTVSMVQKLVEIGIPVSFDKKSVRHCRQLDDQRVYKKAIFGAGFLLSEKAAAEKAAAEKANVIEFKLSHAEMEIVKNLD